MNYEAIAKEVLKFSPVIAGALGSPIASVITSLLCNSFGVTADALPAAISGNPNSATRLRQIELEHGEAIATIGNSDTDNARNREIQIEKITGKSDWVMHLIAVIVVTGFFALCTMNYVLQIKDDHALIMLLGQLSAAFGYVISYYFGSSKKDN